MVLTSLTVYNAYAETFYIFHQILVPFKSVDRNFRYTGILVSFKSLDTTQREHKAPC